MTTLNLTNAFKKVCNPGFVRLVDCMPRVIPQGAESLKCDHAIVQAARVSVGEGLKDETKDKKLIKYLLRHRHTSPFEMVRFKFHVKAPIFVQRQWVRHRTANINEISGRYSELKDEFYTPFELKYQSKDNKQMSGFTIYRKEIKELFEEYMKNSINQYDNYKKLLDMGVSRETARIGLPQNLFTEFYWCIDLHNLMNFIKLRYSSDAQPEIIKYARAIKNIVQEFCPTTMEAFEEYVLDSVTFSKDECEKIHIKDITTNSSNTKKSIGGVPLNQLVKQSELDTKIIKINNMPERDFPFLM